MPKLAVKMLLAKEGRNPENLKCAGGKGILVKAPLHWLGTSHNDLRCGLALTAESKEDEKRIGNNSGICRPQRGKAFIKRIERSLCRCVCTGKHPFYGGDTLLFIAHSKTTTGVQSCIYEMHKCQFGRVSNVGSSLRCGKRQEEIKTSQISAGK